MPKPIADAWLDGSSPPHNENFRSKIARQEHNNGRPNEIPVRYSINQLRRLTSGSGSEESHAGGSRESAKKCASAISHVLRNPKSAHATKSVTPSVSSLIARSRTSIGARERVP